MKILESVLWTVLLVSNAGAQELLEGIAAQVGRELVFLSEVEERAYMYSLRGSGVPGPPTEDDRARALEELIDEQILQVYAKEQQIQVGEAAVQEAVEGAMADVRANFASDREFSRALEAEGLTEADLRENYRREIRDKLVRDRVIARDIYDQVEVSRREVQEFYEEHKDELERSDRSFAVQQVAVPVPLVEPQAQAARALLDSLRNVIEGPGQFSSEATRHSSDRGTAERGGELGWIERGSLVEEIETAAAELEPGQMSDVIRSRFGLHLFYLDAREEGRSRLFHILRPVTPDEERSQTLLDELRVAREAVIAGQLSWEQLEARFPQRVSDTSGTREFQEDEIPTTLRSTLLSMQPGTITDVLSTPLAISLMRLDAINGGRVRTLGQLYPGIEERLRLQKLDERFGEWIKERRQHVFVRIQPIQPSQEGSE